jgi:hypothetical protein
MPHIFLVSEVQKLDSENIKGRKDSKEIDMMGGNAMSYDWLHLLRKPALSANRYADGHGSLKCNFASEAHSLGSDLSF